MTRGQLRMRDARAKEGRREAILDAAAALFGARAIDELTMDEVADRARLAKGTLYLYFASKEELFLGLVERELWAWFDAVDARLESFPHDLDRLAAWLASSVASRPAFARLLAVLHAVVERNLPLRAARRFKVALLERLARTGGRLDEVLGLHRGQGAELLLTVHALVVGLRQMSDPPPVIAQVLRAPALAPLRVDFERALAQALRALLRGVAENHRVRRSS